MYHTAYHTAAKYMVPTGLWIARPRFESGRRLWSHGGKGGFGGIPEPPSSYPDVPDAPPGRGAQRSAASSARGSNRRFDGARRRCTGMAVQVPGTGARSAAGARSSIRAAPLESRWEGRLRWNSGAALFVPGRSRGAARTRRAALAHRTAWAGSSYARGRERRPRSIRRPSAIHITTP
jgi:hypothetical protein